MLKKFLWQENMLSIPMVVDFHFTTLFCTACVNEMQMGPNLNLTFCNAFLKINAKSCIKSCETQLCIIFQKRPNSQPMMSYSPGNITTWYS